MRAHGLGARARSPIARHPRYAQRASGYGVQPSCSNSEVGEVRRSGFGVCRSTLRVRGSGSMPARPATGVRRQGTQVRRAGGEVRRWGSGVSRGGIEGSRTGHRLHLRERSLASRRSERETS
jgi:hypothetical protein